MIVNNRFRIGEVFQVVWRELALLFVLDVLVTIAYVGLGWTWIVPRDLPMSLLGTGLGVFLGLRNNTAYARWWEARTLWGAVVNHSRSFARGLALLLPQPESRTVRETLIRYQIAWAHALRCSLHGTNPRDDIRGFVSPETYERIAFSRNAPFAIQREIADGLRGEMYAGRLDSIQASSLNTTLGALADAQGGLERIKNTQLPEQYDQLPRIFVTAYCLLLPFAIVPDLNLLTPVGSLALAVVFLALDEAGRHLQDPFARSIHDVPMASIARMIEIDLRDALGEHQVLEPLRPVRGVLP